MKPKMTIGAFGIKSWYLNGELHREDGPAVEYPDGIKLWYINGEHHRIDGPAVEYSDGKKFYYIDDLSLTEQQWLNKVLFYEVKINSL